MSGIPFEAPEKRVSRLEESVQIIKRLFGNDPVTFAGEYFTILNLKNYPPPIQQPHPPILIGGGGRRMLSIAAREANVVSIMPPGVASRTIPNLQATSMSRGVQRVREVADDRFDQLELNTLLQRIVITNDTRQVADDLALQWNMTAEDAIETPWALIGTVDQIVETLRARREQFGVSYWVVHDRYIDDFAPVVARLVGT